jgi:hypothetical protein
MKGTLRGPSVPTIRMGPPHPSVSSQGKGRARSSRMLFSKHCPPRIATGTRVSGRDPGELQGAGNPPFHFRRPFFYVQVAFGHPKAGGHAGSNPRYENTAFGHPKAGGHADRSPRYAGAAFGRPEAGGHAGSNPRYENTAFGHPKAGGHAGSNPRYENTAFGRLISGVSSKDGARGGR